MWITVSADDLPFDLIWVDDFESLSAEDLGDSDIKGDTLILFSNLNPLKTGMLQVLSTVYYADQFSQNMVINLNNNNGLWEVVSVDIPAPSSTHSALDLGDESTPLSFEDISSIYKAAILQAYTIDNPMPGVEISTLYLLQSTELAKDPMILPPEVQMGITEALAPLPFEVIWVEDRADNPSGDTDRDGAIITFGHIVLHNDGTVEVMIDLFFSEENRILVTYILENIDGDWQITDFGGMG